MDSSRDDFVIAIRSAFLNKGYKQRFSLIGLIFFSIILLTLGRFNFKVVDYIKLPIKEIVYRSSFITSIPEKFIIKSYFKIKDHFVYYEDYLFIKNEFKKTKTQNKKNIFIINENIRLKKIIDDYFVNSNDVVAKVLIDKESPFLRSIILNKGSKDKIKLGMAVMEDGYLVGKIIEVNFLTSKALLLSDLNSKIPVVIEPGGIQSILSGTGSNMGVIQYQKDKGVIKGESIVYSSGSGGIFKAGIPIGKVIVGKSTTTLNRPNNIKKKVTFFSDLSQLRFINVVSFKKEIKK